jgi:hypothetical protein
MLGNGSSSAGGRTTMTLMARAQRRPESRWEKDNRIPLNPAVFVVFAVLGLVLAGLFLLFALVL